MTRGSEGRRVGGGGVPRRPLPLAILALATLALGLLVITAGLVTGSLELVIGPPDGGEPLLILPLEPDERFTIRYRHSVDRTPVWEVHSLDASGEIFIEEERFVMFGAGMGHLPGRGTLVSRGPYQAIENMHTPTGDFRLRVGSPGVDHTVLWRGESIDLTRAAAGQLLEVSGRRVSLLRHLWRRVTGHVARTAV